MDSIVKNLPINNPESLIFSTYSDEEIKKLSAIKVITPLTFNDLGHSLPGGIYDPALGPSDSLGNCATCKSRSIKCTGHFGYIELPLPVVNPLFHKVVYTVLQYSCLECYRILIPNLAKYLLTCQLKLLEKGLYVEAYDIGIEYGSLLSSIKNGTCESGSEALALDKLEKELKYILNNKAIPTLEVKGECNLRNEFINSIFGYKFKGSRCPYCKNSLKKIKFIKNKIFFDGKTGYIFVTPKECKNYLEKIWANDSGMMTTLIPVLKNQKGSNPVDPLFMNSLFLTPTNCRPMNFVDGVILEHPQNRIYKMILEDCFDLNGIIFLLNNEGDSDGLLAHRKDAVEGLRGNDYSEKLHYAWQKLQRDVDSILDVEMGAIERLNGLGLKQIIEKKEGILRMNMMGKRVNYASRTVITPDPNLNIDEIGIPEVFAKRLTYPTPVTFWNVTELRKLVMNGPDVHPGANYIQDEDKRIIKISGKDRVSREAIAKRLLTPGDKIGFKIVYRHVVNGDILLLNRQPTLHRPSIMGHKARILKGEKTFRLHYANCKSYNADFDGDEMNAHLPQNEVARSEAYNLSSVSTQYLSPKDGTPLSGLIQDHIISGVKLTLRGKMFSKDLYMQLVFQALSGFVQGDITLVKPCILKPTQLWSGKQIISTILLNLIPKDKVPINLISISKIPPKAWLRSKPRPWIAGGTPFRDDFYMTESEIVIRNGKLLCGALDKAQYGATPYGLVHCLYELYGGEVSSAFLSSLSKLFGHFIKIEGFSFGSEDVLLVAKAEKKRHKTIQKGREIGDEVVSKLVDVPLGSTLVDEVAQLSAKDPLFHHVLDRQYKLSLDQHTNKINKICMNDGLLKTFPHNTLQLMVRSGAKGSTVNAMQISCLLGQTELEGKRPPILLSGKPLPCFTTHDTSPRAGGFIADRYLTGLKQPEFSYHCMAGREGLIDTAVKTSRSGYLQRCLVKHLEGLKISYDMTLRDSDGCVVQFLYGEDGMDVMKSQFLKENQLPFLVDNISAIRRDKHDMKDIKESSDLTSVKEHRKLVKDWKKKTCEVDKRRQSGFILFSQEMKDSIEKSTSIKSGSGRSYHTLKLCEKWYKLTPEERQSYEERCLRTPDTTISKFLPNKNFGAISEKIEDLIDHYFEKSHYVDIKVKTLRDLISEKTMDALCEPGESVGLLAAQSVGEPSTQMTLNTFHFAGRGEMNATLGIPRLREILMVASKNIKTPFMVIPFKKDLPMLDDHVNHLKKHLTRITLADVLEKVNIYESIQISSRNLVFKLRMQFLPHDAFKDNTNVKPKQILKHVEKKFLKSFVRRLDKKKNKEEIIFSSTGQNGDEGGNDDDDEESGGKNKKSKQPVRTEEEYESSGDEPEGNDDDDASAAKRRQQHQEEYNYSDLEDEDKSVQEEMGNDEVQDALEGVEFDGEEDETKLTQDHETTLPERPNDPVLSNKYTTINSQCCELNIILPPRARGIDIASKLKEECHSSVIHEIPGIKKAFIETDNITGAPTIKTAGTNFLEILAFDDIIDVKRLYTNDIHAMANMYGIDAAKSVIVKEVEDVFKVYGITVDRRHLSLISSYMTFEGIYKPFSRKGMESGASPFQKMTFESSLGFLKSAVRHCQKDGLASPSSRLAIGTPVKSGTGSFRLLHDLTKNSGF